MNAIQTYELGKRQLVELLEVLETQIKEGNNIAFTADELEAMIGWMRRIEKADLKHLPHIRKEVDEICERARNIIRRFYN